MQAEGKGCPGGSFLTDAGLIVSGAKNGNCEQIKNGGQEVFPAGADLPYVQYENQFDVIGGSVKSMCMGGSPVPNSKVKLFFVKKSCFNFKNVFFLYTSFGILLIVLVFLHMVKKQQPHQSNKYSMLVNQLQKKQRKKK